jgi:hypothetical protein
LVAKLPAQACRFKLRISLNLCENFGDPFLDTTGVSTKLGQVHPHYVADFPPD